MTGKEVIKILEQHGWKILRIAAAIAKQTGGYLKMISVLFPAIFEYDQSEKRYTIHFPDLEEAITEGLSLEEAV